MESEALKKAVAALENSVSHDDNKIQIKDEAKVRANIHELVRLSAFGSEPEQAWARYLTRLIALELGAIPASIHELYMARGRGEVPPAFTVPAMNLRALSFEAARAVFRNAKQIDAGAFIFEIARSEIGYTEQRPAEYATNILGAAIAESYNGPVFIQGDHFQISASRYAQDPKKEVETVEALTAEAIAAGFYNIDIDSSTLVDLKQTTVPEQQRQNAVVSAHFTEYIRDRQPEGVMVSVGGEIGEVGGRNSNEEELVAYVNEYILELHSRSPEAVGISKISIQTGTSHGGVVMPDGTVAKVKVDFETLLKLSRVARLKYHTAGAVQHGASTLPDEAFGKFVESEACEVHLATNFQTMLYDRIPKALLSEVYAYVDEKSAGDRKPDQTDEQFHYENRKRALGPFKQRLWDLDASAKATITDAWEQQFAKLFGYLAIGGTRKYVDQFVRPVKVMPDREFYFGKEAEQEEVKDLSD